MSADTPASKESQRQIASSVASQLQSSWNRADAAAFAALFANDADFVNVRGEYAAGREAIATAHAHIWGSFYAASDDGGSLKDLARVISVCERRGIQPPAFEVFADSRFKDRHGWGDRISKDQRDRWRAASAG